MDLDHDANMFSELISCYNYAMFNKGYQNFPAI